MGGEARYSLELISGTDIVLFHWVGPITIEDRLENLERMTGFCAKHSVRKILIDGRDHENETPTLDAYDFGAEVPNAFRGLVVAVLTRPDDKMLKFIETVAYNRGARSKSFHDFGQAKKWLESL